MILSRHSLIAVPGVVACCLTSCGGTQGGSSQRHSKAPGCRGEFSRAALLEMVQNI